MAKLLAYVMRGRLYDGQLQFEKAIKLNARLASGHYNLGVILAQRGQIPLAIEHFRIAIDIGPDYADARRALAIVLINQGEYERGIEQLEAIKTHAPQLAPEIDQIIKQVNSVAKPRQSGP